MVTRPESGSHIEGVEKDSEKKWPRFEQDEIKAAVDTLRSGKVNYWTGQEGRQFEREFAAFHDVSHAIALANGSVALELALIAFDIGEGADVLVSPRSFFASAGSAVIQGANPVFADVDRDSQNVTVETLAAALTSRTRAVILVHLAGWPCDMDAITAFAADHDLVVIEDCAQAHGARWNGRPVGSFGAAAAFSFCQDKIMTTGGEGGMMLTSAESAWSKAWSYKDHGKDWDAVFSREHEPGYRWLHESFGTNWRMTEMQAAIGRIQLRKLPAWSARRTRNAEFLAGALQELPALRVPVPPANAHHAWYKFGFFVRPDALKAGWSRDRILVEIAAAGLPCFSGSCPEIYLERAFKNGGYMIKDRLPVAKELGETSLMVLVDHTQTESDMDRAASVISSVVARAQR